MGMEQTIPFGAAMVVATIAVFTDTRQRRIPNLLTFPAMALGLAWHTTTDGLSGLGFASLGLALGLGLHALPFLLGGMGGGDVKLLAALGAFLGPQTVFWTFAYAALLGGTVALVLIARTLGWSLIFLAMSGGPGTMFALSRGGLRVVGFPYALVMWCGVAAAYVVR